MSLRTFVIAFMTLIVIMAPVLSEPVKIMGGTTSPDSPAENAISADQNIPDYLVYNETFAGYSLYYPDKAGIMVTGSENTTRESLFLTPSNLSILKVSVVPTNMTLKELVNSTTTRLHKLQDFSLLGMNDTTIGNTTGKVIDYTWTDKIGSTSHTTMMITVKDNRAYVLTSQFPEEAYDRMKPVIDVMSGSFRFIPVAVEKGYNYDPWYGWYWWPDTADWGNWNWGNYMQGTSDNYFSSTDYWGSGMDWIDVSNKRWDWYWND